MKLSLSILCYFLTACSAIFVEAQHVGPVDHAPSEDGLGIGVNFVQNIGGSRWSVQAQPVVTHGGDFVGRVAVAYQIK